MAHPHMFTSVNGTPGSAGGASAIGLSDTVARLILKLG